MSPGKAVERRSYDAEVPPPRREATPDSAQPPTSQFTFPNRVLFGAGTRRSLHTEIDRLGIARPLIVSDPGVVSAGLTAEFADPLQTAALFQEVRANPTESDVLAGLDCYRQHGCDGLIGLGGGSALDAAKAIRLLVTHPGRLADYDYTHGGLDRITPQLPPMIAIPTTAGTGSEAGRGTLIQVAESGRKMIALSPYLLPSAAICDPVLTRGLPPALTAGTGMDALTHCVESFLSPVFHPICDGIATEGLRYIFKGLETAVRDGKNLEARTAMMAGALMGGISFHKGLGVVHSLSHALGSVGRVHHGTLNAILLPHALRFNRQAADARMSDLASRVGLGRGGDASGHLITLSELILARLPLPRRLRELDGLHHVRIGDYARLAMLDHCHRTNPRPCALADMEDLLDRAW
jgi:alcohol dehydrogenase class IV